MPRHFGHVAGVPIGSHFEDREALAAARIHRPTQAGISGGRREGADSIVLSGGYIDDEDFGTYIHYTGAGGRDPNTRQQIADQDINYHSNAALVLSELEGYPVRVTRGSRGHSRFAPNDGYRYEGLYRVTDHWDRKGSAGWRIVQFKLEQIDPLQTVQPIRVQDGSSGPVETRSMVVQRQIRNSEIIRRVKRWYEHRCQICGVVIDVDVDGGYYAEGAHIQGLGSPHFGPDVISNVLCLCPNDHVRFDYGVLHLTDDLIVVNTRTGEKLNRLITVPRHSINVEYVAYHREHVAHQTGRL